MAQGEYNLNESNVRLRSILEELGYHYRRFARMLGKTDTSVYRWIKGQRRPSQEAMVFAETLLVVPEFRAHMEEKAPAPQKPRGKPFPSKGSKDAGE